MGLFKKMLVGGLVAGGAIAAFKGTHALTHVRHEVRQVRVWADDQIPMEKKFKVLRDEVAALDGEVDRVKNELSKEIVEVRDLQVTTARLRAKVAQDKADLIARGKAIEDGTALVKHGRPEVSVDQAKARLVRDVAAHTQDKGRLETYEQTLAYREENLSTLRQTKDALVGQKDVLLAEINSVEADYKRLQLAQVKSKFQTDDTKLAKIKERLRDIKKAVEVKKVRLEMEPTGKEAAPPVTESVEDILKPVTGGAAPKADPKPAGKAKGDAPSEIGDAE